MTDWSVTINLGGPRQTAAAQEGMLDWTREMLAGSRRPVVIFAQETYPAWRQLVSEAGYQLIEGVERDWNVRSAIVVDKSFSIRPLTESDLPHLRYHGTYLAAGIWTRADGTQAVLASVHASPSYAEPERYAWPAETVPPTTRHGGADPRWPNDRSWDSDYLLRTLHELVERFNLPVLAAGDLNESLLDDPEGGTWGTEYFSNANKLGVTAWLHEQWRDEMKQEIPTRGGLQLDHILVARGGEALLRTEPAPEVDAHWSHPTRSSHLSDHAAIWFALAEPGTSHV